MANTTPHGEQRDGRHTSSRREMWPETIARHWSLSNRTMAIAGAFQAARSAAILRFGIRRPARP